MEVRLATKEEAEKALAGEAAPLVPLGLDMHCCATAEEMHENFYATLDRGYVPISECLYAYSGSVSIVGAGPSIKTTYKELKADVLAINSAIGFLIDRGIAPKWAMLWDASPLVANFAVPHPDTTYLVASRCHPSVFERLKDCKVRVWHAGGDHDIHQVMETEEVQKRLHGPEPLINGGSAGITRAIGLVQALGYSDIHVFGADSSYSGDDTHVNGSLVPEKDMLVAIGNNPPIWFRTTPEWVAQVEEYKAIVILMHDHGITMEVYGDGMLPTMHRLLVKKRELLGHAPFLEQMQAQIAHRRQLDADASRVAEEMKRIEANPLQEKENVQHACL